MDNQEGGTVATRISDYAAAITDESRKELERIATHFTGHPAKPFLVGGWAVYCHTKTQQHTTTPNTLEGNTPKQDGFTPLGSKDIDMVFGNSHKKQAFEYDYCKHSG
jgi:hypothetical protein